MIPVANLKGTALDWAVAVCEDQCIAFDPMGFKNGANAGFWIWDERDPKNKIYQIIGADYSPSTNWSQAGPIIEKHNLYPSCYYGCGAGNPNKYQAGMGLAWSRGETPLIATMRALVRDRFGDEIELPNEILSQLATL
ncbi:phage protein NinX family protein [uncultured Alteromonas sp.]|jgi:hypothetical protein|uniref:phage protein NinX family protein n=1 Tax=uncultured Alteromonas sp. TaxID=179113 RepID=UPI0030CF3578|tara:strand:+ start:56356 stop:56769 length:414 start_codon:yes stop_codon:yes gene_type:complete